MSAIPLVGPSYTLRSIKADSQRTVGWMPVQIESGDGKGGFVGYLKQQPGLVRKLTLPAEIRGMFCARGTLYAVSGPEFYRINSDWSSTLIGVVGSTGSVVDMQDNATQLAIVQGATGHIYDLDTGALTAMPANFPGSTRFDVLDGYGVFAAPGGYQFGITSSQDFSQIDDLDFASAEGTTGNIVAHIVRHREVIFLKENTGEVWYDAGGSDFAFSRNDGAAIEAGCSAPYTLQKVGGVVYWLGREEKGAAVVFGMSAYSPQRISSHALEEKLAAVSDLSTASAFTYHQEGLTFYVLQVPELQTTWVYEVASGVWHERAEWNGDYSKWRAKCHAYAYGEHLVGDASGKIYVLEPTANTNDGDTLIRDRITPHQAMPTQIRQRYGSMQIECDVGNGLPTTGNQASLLLRASNDGGRTWGNWRTLTIGSIGQYRARARATMLGSARDRVWHIRCTDDVMANLLSAVVGQP